MYFQAQGKRSDTLGIIAIIITTAACKANGSQTQGNTLGAFLTTCGESKDKQKGWYSIWVPALNLSIQKSFTGQQ